MRRTRFLFGLSFLLAIALAVTVRRYVRASEVAEYELAPRSAEEVAAEARARGFEPLEVERQAALIRRPVSGHAWVVYWGGNTSAYFHEALQTIEGLRLPSDVGVLIIAPPGYDSEGHPTPLELERAAVNTRQWLRREERAERIVTGGFSLGTYSALVAAERDVVGTFLMGALRAPDAYKVNSSPPKVPAVVVQGGKDDVKHARQVAEWLGAKFVLVPGVTHADTQRSDTVLRAVRDFVEVALQ